MTSRGTVPSTSAARGEVRARGCGDEWVVLLNASRRRFRRFGAVCADHSARERCLLSSRRMAGRDEFPWSQGAKDGRLLSSTWKGAARRGSHSQRRNPSRNWRGWFWRSSRSRISRGADGKSARFAASREESRSHEAHARWKCRFDPSFTPRRVQDFRPRRAGREPRLHDSRGWIMNRSVVRNPETERLLASGAMRQASDEVGAGARGLSEGMCCGSLPNVDDSGRAGRHAHSPSMRRREQGAGVGGRSSFLPKAVLNATALLDCWLGNTKKRRLVLSGSREY